MADTTTNSDLLPLRMLNEYAYCPRLFHFMFVEGRWEDNQFTVEGRHAHRRVDALDHLLPHARETQKPPANADARAGGDEPPAVARSVPVSSAVLGLSAKLDLVATDGDEAVPVETKRGRVPDNPQRSWEPERVQLMAQGLLLRENGYQCDHGVLYFAGSRTRVRIDFTAELEARTRDLLSRARVAMRLTVLPPPLVDSPKCNGCSLAGICLPDETNALLNARVESPADTEATPAAARDAETARDAGTGRDQTATGAAFATDAAFATGGHATGDRASVADATVADATVNDEPAADPPNADPPATDPAADMAADPVADTANAMAADPVDTSPDATQTRRAARARPPDAPAARRLYPVRDDATPFYVQEPGAYVGCAKQRIIVKKGGEELASVRLQDVSQLVLCGNIQLSTQAVQSLCKAEIPIVYLSMGHQFYGVTSGINLRNAYDRAAQFKAAANPAMCLAFARRIVADKAENQRTMIRRNAPSDAANDRVLEDIDYLVQRLGAADIDSTEKLLGIEGAIAAAYFSRFSTLLKPRDFDAQWDFNSRNRRPPKDPVNALLSFGYAMLTKECTVALLSEGLDPWWGLYHQPRHGRPALALDIMEPFRPAVVDSAVITAINTGMVQRSSFDTLAGACILKPEGRKGIIRAYDARLDQLITHPAFDYKCSWRVVIRLQARLLARWFRGEIPNYTSITTR